MRLLQKLHAQSLTFWRKVACQNRMMGGLRGEFLRKGPPLMAHANRNRESLQIKGGGKLRKYGESGSDIGATSFACRPAVLKLIFNGSGLSGLH